MLLTNSTDLYLNTTTEIPPSDGNNPVHFKRLRFIFVPLFVLFTVFLMSALVYLVVRKRRIDRLRHHLVPLYNFDPAERDDWEAELLDDSVDARPSKKGYQSMQSSNGNQ